MSKSIYVIGAGPRGLSLCLYGLLKGLKVTLIDPHPLSQWAFPNILPDLEMRSPITFDLATYVPELKAYSLSKYLKDPVKATTQAEVELNETKVNRSQFLAYLESILSLIESDIELIRESVISIEKTELRLESRTLEIPPESAVIYAGGCNQIKIPKWVNHTQLSSKTISLSQLLKNQLEYDSSNLTIIGSGQAAAEAVNYFSDRNEVTWLLQTEPRISQYPGPSYKDWGIRSTLGSFYSTLSNWNDRTNYLASVKKLQPTITPTISNSLTGKSYQKILPSSSVQLDSVFKSCDLILPLTGFLPDIDQIPVGFKISRNPFLPAFPEIDQAFQLKAGSRFPFYVSGLLALAFDGPRQGSLVSSGITAKTIVDHFISN